MKEEPKYNKSENDNLFFEIFGYYPAKAGKAYEILSTAAYAIATRASNAVLDTRVRGEMRGTPSIGRAINGCR